MLSYFRYLISDSAHRNNLKILIVAETLPQSADMHINGVGVALAVVPPDFIHKLLTGKNPAGNDANL